MVRRRASDGQPLWDLDVVNEPIYSNRNLFMKNDKLYFLRGPHSDYDDLITLG